MTPLTSGGDVRTDWRSINQLNAEIEELRRQLFAMQHPSGRRQIYGGGLNLPLRIYQASTWLKFKVTTIQFISTGVAVEPSNAETELTITSGVAEYWFALDLTGATPLIVTSSTLPTWAVDMIPIGWVDTTDTTNSISVIHQHYPLHLFIPCV